MRLADAYAISLGLWRMHKLEVPPTTIRSWANRKLIGRHGRNERRQTLYDFDEIYDHATRASLAQPADLLQH